MRPKRPSHPRPRKQTILIQCEGQKTEPNYLEELCKACGVRQRVEVKIKSGKGQNAAVTVKLAIAEGKRKLFGERIHDDVWCVLDIEHAAHEATLNQAVALAKDNKIRFFLSNPSFEVWLIAHFERITRPFENGDAAEAYLSEKHWRKRFGCDYEKGDTDLYDKLAADVQTAIANAQWVLETFHENKPCRMSNASTEVYQLVRELLSM